MVGVRPSLRAGMLAATLAALPVRVDPAHVMRNDVWLVDYPSGPRGSWCHSWLTDNQSQ